jgi:tetratricopeptide (TPR) repeat protein
MENRMDQAESVFAEGFKANPRSPGLYSELIQFYIAAGRFDAAVAVCEDRIREQPQDAFSHNLLGKVYAAWKKYAPAEAAFQRAVEILPMWPEPNNNLANLYLVQGKKDEAVRKFESALKDNPKNPAAYLSLGSIHEQSGDREKAVQIYRKALEAEPDLWPAANNLAVLLGENPGSAQDLEKALDLAKRADALKPGEPMVQDTLGWIYYKTGELQMALTYLEDALAEASDVPIFNYHAGMILHKLGRGDEAKGKLSKALESKAPFTGREEAAALFKTL